MRELFATRLHEARLTEAGLIAELEDAVWMLEEGDAAGHDWCEREGYPGYTSYASLDDLPQRAPAFAALKTALDRQAAAFAQALHWDLGARTLRLDALWVNILGEGMVHSGHIHPGSVISGTCYVAMPEGAGAIRFEDPRLPAMMAAPQPLAEAPEALRRFVYLAPAPGDILMWESWLRHEVMPGTSQEPRLSVSFNYALR
ncbi:MAG: hypothetical protein GVY06_03215 [Alphaproteobacteria bacterium]|jgi:uncharacterized protein (TIGR02466 family)|nr:hypothetical protein [Alphaproteobacteria bacterium]